MIGKKRSSRLVVACAMGSLISGLAGAAHAQSTEPESDIAGRDTCLAGHERAQELKIDGKLIDSKKALLSCAEEQCPAIVRADCVRWLDEVESAIPTIVVIAASDSGDEVNVSVAVDGRIVASRLNGQPIELDPGAHDLAFEFSGADTQKVRLNLGQGEKNRMVRLDFRTKPVVTPPLQISAPALGPPTVETRPIPVITYVLGGLSLAAASSATFFGVHALSAQNSANSCKPICRTAVADDVRQKALYADLSLVATALAAGGALVSYAIRPTSVSSQQPRRSDAMGASWSIGASPFGAVVSVGGTFW